MSRCDMEDCPMWDGHTCPCETHGLDRDDLPTSGIYTVETPVHDDDLPTICECGDPIDCGHCGDCPDCTHDHSEEGTDGE